MDTADVNAKSVVVVFFTYAGQFIVTEIKNAIEKNALSTFLDTAMIDTRYFKYSLNDEIQKNSRGYPINSFLLRHMGTAQILDCLKDIQDYHEDYLMPALEAPENQTKLFKNAVPVFDNVHSFVVAHVYSDIMHFRDINKFVECVLNEPSSEVYFKRSLDNLYSFWHRGQLPLMVYRCFHLSEEHVDPEDFTRLTQELVTVGQLPSHDQEEE